MTEVKLTFSVPHPLRPKLRAVRLVVDHLLDTLGVPRWRWEFYDGATKEVLWGPFSESFAETFHVPTGAERVNAVLEEASLRRLNAKQNW